MELKLAEADDHEPATVPNSKRFPAILERYVEGGGDAEELDTLSINQLIGLGVEPEVFKDELARAFWHDGGGADEDYDNLPAEDKEALERSAVKQAKASLAFPD